MIASFHVGNGPSAAGVHVPGLGTDLNLGVDSVVADADMVANHEAAHLELNYVTGFGLLLRAVGSFAAHTAMMCACWAAMQPPIGQLLVDHDLGELTAEHVAAGWRTDRRLAVLLPAKLDPAAVDVALPAAWRTEELRTAALGVARLRETLVAVAGTYHRTFAEVLVDNEMPTYGFDGHKSAPALLLRAAATDGIVTAAGADLELDSGRQVTVLGVLSSRNQLKVLASQPTDIGRWRWRWDSDGVGVNPHTLSSRVADLPMLVRAPGTARFSESVPLSQRGLRVLSGYHVGYHRRTPMERDLAWRTSCTARFEVECSRAGKVDVCM